MTESEINKTFLSYAVAEAHPGVCIVDDETTADLELDEVFARLDRTLTTPGQSVLYALLRMTPTDNAGHEGRADRLGFYRERPGMVAVIRKLLSKVGLQASGDAAHEVFAFPDLGMAAYRPWIAVWIALTLASYFSPVFLGLRGLLYCIMPMALINLAIYAKTTARIEVHAGSLYYIGNMAALCGRVAKARNLGESEEAGRLAAHYRSLKAVISPAFFLRPVSSFGGDIGESLLLYIKIFALGELYCYLKAATMLRDKGEELRSLYKEVGAIDAWCAMAVLSREPGGPIPARVLSGSRRIAAQELRHPLVEGCVPVGFTFARGVILTGTNMSGKSTFLRSLGIAQVLATNLCITYAKSFETDLFFVVSSIRSEDDRSAGRSRYLAEAERLLGIVGSIRAGEPPLLALIDEILNGTNSQDRIVASIAILRGVAGKGSIIVAATHDLEIADSLRGDYDPRFFSERIEDGRLVFDYGLREGMVDRKNALRILRLIGFGDDILGPS
jgi:hypothetical protein